MGLIDRTGSTGDGRDADNGRRRGPARTRRKAAAVLGVAAVLMLSACGGGGGGGHNAKTPPTGKDGAPKESAARVTIAPQDGATGVSPGALKVSATGGKLTQVQVSADNDGGGDGGPVDGALSPDASTWQPKAPLHTGTRYSVDATAVDPAGLKEVQHSTFTTLTPDDVNIANFNTDPGETYGVGMIVSLDFTKPVKNQAAVDQAVTVTADPGVEVKGHWFGDQRLDFRPEKYWAPGTKVTLHLALDGVQTSPGVYGKQAKNVTFTIGRSQTSVADNDAKTLTVSRDGAVTRTIPASLGSPEFTTWNGVMVISEKDSTVHMDSQTVGLGQAYDIPDVPHAMRLTESGTFVHGNYWGGPSVFGNENTSHGCVGLQDVRGGGDSSTPAAWFFDHSLIGDVVKVVNSPDKQVEPDNGLSGWNESWAQWTSGGSNSDDSSAPATDDGSGSSDDGSGSGSGSDDGSGSGSGSSDNGSGSAPDAG